MDSIRLESLESRMLDLKISEILRNNNLRVMEQQEKALIQELQTTRQRHSELKLRLNSGLHIPIKPLYKNKAKFEPIEEYQQGVQHQTQDKRPKRATSTF